MRRCALSIFATLTLLLAAPAQDASGPFKLRWYGQSFFQLETPLGRKIVFDPHAIPEFERPTVTADIILCSHLHDDHTMIEAVTDHKSARVFYGLEDGKKGRPPEWKKVDEKIGQVRVRTVGLYHDAQDGLARGKNSAWVVEAYGLRFCHLGDIGHELSDTQAKAIGPVDVLMVPVGGVFTTNGEQAQAIVAKLKPRLYVLPMHYGVPGYDELLGPEEFLDGPSNVRRTPDTNELLIPPDLMTPAPAVVVLGWKKK